MHYMYLLTQGFKKQLFYALHVPFNSKVFFLIGEFKAPTISC
jgi:hypothetical protein